MSHKNQHRAWTPEELNLLTLYYGTMPNLELQQRHLTQRNVRAIEIKAMRLGLSKNQSSIKWSDNELDILKTYGGQLTPQEIHAKYLPNRTPTAILLKMSELKGHRNRHTGRTQQSAAKNRTPWTDDELDILRQYYRIMTVPAIQQKYLPDRSMHAIENMARVIVPPKTKQWLPSEIILLKRYYKKIPTETLKQKYLPDRTQNQISSMAARLGLSKPHKKKAGEKE